LITASLPAGSASAQSVDSIHERKVSIHGKEFYLDGKPWLPKGIAIEGFNRPILDTLPAWTNKSAQQARSWYNPAELQAMKRVFGGFLTYALP